MNILMRQRIKAAAIPLLTLLVLYLAIRFLVIPMMSPLPDNLGMRDGDQLAGCPPNNNCVSSFARMTDLAHYVVPLRYEGDLEEARRQVTALIAQNPMVVIHVSEGEYIHAEYHTSVIGLIDDLELHFDEAEHVIHVRSASRLGGNDFGGNRQRVEYLRNELEMKLGWEQE